MAAVQIAAAVAMSDPRVTSMSMSSPVVQSRRLSHSRAVANPTLRLLSSTLPHTNLSSRRDRSLRQRVVAARRSLPLRAEPRVGERTVQPPSPRSSRKAVRASAVTAPKEGAQAASPAAADARSRESADLAEVGGNGAGRAAEAEATAVVLLDVREMMCGGCAAAVRQVLSAHPRVISAGVNLVTESAAVTVSLRAPEASGSPTAPASPSASFPSASAKPSAEAAELDSLRAELAELVDDAGFPCSVRSAAEADEEAEARRREAAERRQRAVARARVDVAVAGVLAGLCCAHHVGHLLHGMGLHALAHGPWMAVLDDVRVRSAIAAVALLGPARDLLWDGMRALLRLSPNMNSLVGLASLAAFCIGVVAQLYPDLGLDSSFTDEPVMLLAVVLLGRSLEASARAQASSDLNALMSLLPSTARLLVDDDSTEGEQAEGAGGRGGEGGMESGSEEEGEGGLALSMAAWVQVPANHVRPGDKVLVLPGDVIPVDGTVVHGRSAVDESLQTGEAATVAKRRGAAVAAGTVNWEGPIVVAATATGASCAVCEMARRVEDAQQRTAPVQRLADAIAGPFVFTIMSLAAATFTFWYTVGVNLYPQVLLSDYAGDDSDPLVLSLRLAISVLVVACPCALGLATPTAILVGTSLGARRGLLLRGGDVLERLAAMDVVAFDKTGTLTAGQPQVSAVVPASHLPVAALPLSLHQATSPQVASSYAVPASPTTALPAPRMQGADTNAADPNVADTVSLLRLAAAAESSTRHPVAAAITTHAARLSAAPLPPVSSALTVPGRGVVAVVDGREIHVGAFDWVAKHCLRGQGERERRGVEGERWRRVEEGVLSGECGGVEGEGGEGDRRDSSSSHTFVYVGEVRSEGERRGEEGVEGSRGQGGGSRSGGGILGCICVSDSVRTEAQQTVSSLASLGVSAAVLSGDRQAAVNRVAQAVGITDSANVLGRLLPEGKEEAIERMQREGHTVAMVGDGINDTLALAHADVGVAVPPPGATSAIMSAAADAADLVLLGNRLTQLVDAVHLARATMARVRLNLGWALAYNCLAVPLAAGAFLPAYDVALTPTLAGGLMAGSSVLVVVSSLLLRLHKPPQ
ncbi:hypothetical protein CLOM_g4803 [Closterium sp. NIES-68]|nr:hypothetical protein CLOM_g4803 [Closterium sp. NIES-68]GJP60277.1 hypothetical protein CLOP_g17488 [Closterium sp. NIES-67]